MPELPEVETVVRGLRKRIVGWDIERLHFLSDKLRRDNPSRTAGTLRGERILAIERRGKNILFELSNDFAIWAHLRMTGQFLWRKRNDRNDPYDRARFDLTHSTTSARAVLAFRDVRQFGVIQVGSRNAIYSLRQITTLGPEPHRINAEKFIELLRRRGRIIKTALLDQTLLAGLGNIYSDEALFRAQIHPLSNTARISREKLQILHQAVGDLFTTAISLMGTTFDSYAGVNGEAGAFQSYLLVYGREGQPCVNCRRTIRRETIGSRSAHFCGSCQKRR